MNWLVNEQHRACLALVWHVQEYGESITAAIPAPGVEVDPPDCEVLRRSALTAARFAFLTRYAVAIERGTKPDFETEPVVQVSKSSNVTRYRLLRPKTT